MKSFQISDKIEIVCNWKKTRMAFKHVATLLINGSEIESTKICYQNRTWERYEYESVMLRLVDKSKVLSEEEKKICYDFIKGDHTDWSGFKTTSMVAKLGDLFCDNQKDKNDWKARMLKAGLGNAGLEIPDDWDTLDEDTKQARLDAVIQLAGKTGS